MRPGMRGMIMRDLGFFLAVFAGASAALAQEQGSSPQESADAGNTIAPITSYPLGRADLVAAGMVNALAMNRVKEDLCQRYGCLVIVNESRAYKVMEMRLEMTGKNGAKRWGPNQLDRPLLALQATLRIKVPDLADCDLPVRFRLRETKGREEVALEDRIRLCAEPDRHTLMRIRVVKPRVELDPNP